MNELRRGSCLGEPTIADKSAAAVTDVGLIAECHGAETNLADVQAGAAESYLLHMATPFEKQKDEWRRTLASTRPKFAL
jgi:hypothetical protein